MPERLLFSPDNRINEGSTTSIGSIDSFFTMDGFFSRPNIYGEPSRIFDLSERLNRLLANPVSPSELKQFFFQKRFAAKKPLHFLARVCRYYPNVIPNQELFDIWSDQEKEKLDLNALRGMYIHDVNSLLEKILPEAKIRLYGIHSLESMILLQKTAITPGEFIALPDLFNPILMKMLAEYPDLRSVLRLFAEIYLDKDKDRLFLHLPTFDRPILFALLESFVKKEFYDEDVFLSQGFKKEQLKFSYYRLNRLLLEKGLKIETKNGFPRLLKQ